MTSLRLTTPGRIALIYATVTVVWIIGSDYLVSLWQYELPRDWTFESAKGLLFVVVTSALLYFLLGRMSRRAEAVKSGLRDSQLRWQFALEGAGDGLWDWNLVTGKVFYSTQYKAMFGLLGEEIGDGIEEWKSRIHPDDVTTAWDSLNRHLAGQTPTYESEHRVLCKDGNYKWVLVRGQVIRRNGAGQSRRIIGTVSDISMRRQAEEQMADALAFNQAILESSPVGIITYRPDGTTLSVNKAASRIVGTTPEKLQEQNFRKLESWKKFGLLAAAERVLASGEPVIHSTHIVTSFGRSLWLEARFAVFHYEGQPHLLATLTDETERRRTMVELDLLHAAVRAAPSGWVVTKPDGIIEWVNPAFTRMTGYSFAEVVGRKTSLLKSGEHPARFYAEMWNTIQRGEVWHGQLHNRRKDGTLYHEEMTIAPVHDAQGAIAHYVAMKHDVSEQKRLELQAARTQRLESIGLLASGIAHDLNNILAPILLSTELLKLKYPEAEAKKCLDLMENASQRGAGIVRQVLTFARGIDGARMEVSPRHLLKELGELITETFPRMIQPKVEVAPDVWSIMGDVTQLHQVLLNLTVNARDAMPDGGLLTLQAHNVVVDEATARATSDLRPGPYVVLAVADTGTGIPPGVLEHIFEPFYTTKPRDKGTGLGLSTVYGIVRSHGGVVEVKTKLGVGTEFRVLLPAVSIQCVRSDSKLPVAEIIKGDGRCVLVVDDEESIRWVAAGVLESHGFSCETAVDGLDALDKIRRQPGRFAAVVTDIMMPRMNGCLLAHEIRHSEPSLPIIVSSGMTDEGTVEDSKAELSKLGIKTLLIKPYREEELLHALVAEIGIRPVFAGQKKI